MTGDVPAEYLAANLSALKEQDRLCETTRRTIIKRIWGLSISESAASTEYEPYFSDYEKRCKNLHPHHAKELTHNNILEIVDLLKDTSQTRRNVMLHAAKKLPQSASQDELLRNALEFAVCSLLMIGVSRWEDTKTLKEFLENELLKKSDQPDKARLRTAFNARNLHHVAGIKIFWTSDLMEHLSMKNNDKQVAMFHHAMLLELHKLSSLNILPQEFIEESFRTMALLLPESEGKVSCWFQRAYGRKSYLDNSVSRREYLPSRLRNIEKFEYWRDRLIILKEIYDEHEPRGLIQFWRDDRRSVQWWTFWVALVVFILAIIQCIQGALQVYKAYHPAQQN